MGEALDQSTCKDRSRLRPPASRAVQWHGRLSVLEWLKKTRDTPADPRRRDYNFEVSLPRPKDEPDRCSADARPVRARGTGPGADRRAYHRLECGQHKRQPADNCCGVISSHAAHNTRTTKVTL